MSEISPIGRPELAAYVSQVRPAATPSPAAVPTDDRVELSSAAKLMSRMTDASDAAGRAERVALIRQQIEAGTYETPEKLDIALDRLIRDL